MKFSLLGLCAIAIMMTFSFMTVAPFVPTVDAHNFTGTLVELEAHKCDCGNTVDYTEVCATSVTLSHGSDDAHDGGHPEVIIYDIVSESYDSLCSVCLYDAWLGTSS